MIRAVFLVALVLSSGEAHAQKVTLEQALTLADSEHPLLKAGLARVDASNAAIDTARAHPNPDVSFVAGHQTGQPVGGPTRPVPLYVVNQPIELGALRASRIGVAERNRTAREHELSAVRLGVLSHVRRTFYQVLRRLGERAIAQENLRLVEDLRNRIQVRVDVGEVGRLELVRAEAEVAAARALSSSAQLQQVTALAQFRAAVGGGLPTTVEVEGVLDAPAALPAIEVLRQQAITRHPVLAVARAELDRADARVGYENALKRPQPSLRAEIDMSGPSYRFGVGIPLPAWDRRKGPIAEALASRREAQELARSREIEIVSALDGAYERHQVASQDVQLHEQGLLREAEEALRAAEVAYQLGERGILEVLDAQRLLRTVRLNYLNAQFDRQAALVDLDELRGEELRRNP